MSRFVFDNSLFYTCYMSQTCCTCVDVAKDLIRNGVDVNKREYITELTAIFYSCPLVTNLLIENGADVNIVSKTFEASPLFSQYFQGEENTQKCKILIKNGIDLEIKNYANMTALSYYVACNRYQEVKLLLESGADVSNVSLDDCTDEEILKLLLKFGLDINKTDEYGETVLFKCSWTDSELFMRYGCDVNHTNIYGETAMYYASPTKVKFLIRHVAIVYRRILNSDKMYGVNKYEFSSIEHMIEVRNVIIREHISSITISSFLLMIIGKKISNCMRCIPCKLFDPEFKIRRFKLLGISKEWY